MTIREAAIASNSLTGMLNGMPNELPNEEEFSIPISIGNKLRVLETAGNTAANIIRELDALPFS